MGVGVGRWGWGGRPFSHLLWLDAECFFRSIDRDENTQLTSSSTHWVTRRIQYGAECTTTACMHRMGYAVRGELGSLQRASATIAKTGFYVPAQISTDKPFLLYCTVL